MHPIETNAHHEPIIRLALPHFQSLDSLKSYLPILLQTLESYQVPVEVVIVDDGSSRLLQKLLASWVSRLHSEHAILSSPMLLEQNFGKGYAIRQAWNTAPETIKVLAFVDADGSVPAQSVAEQLLESLQNPEQIRCGVRPKPSKETRSFKRRIMGSLFANYVRKQLKLDVSDPQCGFKMIPASTYRRLRRRFKIDRFAFDGELLALAMQQGLQIVEQELPWVESPTSTVRSLRDGWKMLRDIQKLKKRLRIYDKASDKW